MDELDQLQAQVIRNIATHGWAVQGVGGGENDPAFVYTIGLWSGWRHPEILLMYPSLKIGCAILNIVGAQVQAGVRFGCDEAYPSILQAYRVRFRAIPNPSIGHWFNIAADHYHGYHFSALQLLVPDKLGRFPDDDDYDYHPQPVPYDNT